MFTDIQFQSEHYQMVSWNSIFQDAFSIFNNEIKRCGISCSKKIKCSNFYHDFIESILRNSYDGIKEIFVYTYEHLKNRTANGKILSQNQVIQNQFSDLLILFNIIDDLLLNNTYEYNHIIKKLIAASDQLAKLSGARAVLVGNINELRFYLKVFQRFFL